MHADGAQEAGIESGGGDRAGHGMEMPVCGQESAVAQMSGGGFSSGDGCDHHEVSCS